MSIAGENNPFLLARPELINAKKKISLFSSTYDPLKTNLKGFEVYSLTPTEFKEQLKNCCQIYLTSEELGALVLLFDKDNDGRVNSQAFITEFLRLGNIERKRKVLHQRKVTEQIERKKEKFQIEREKSLEKLSLYTISPNFTQEESQSAYQKLAEMAANYDPQNSIALMAFLNGGEMTALEFKEQLKRSLHINLTSNEIAALVQFVNSEDPNNQNNNQNINQNTNFNSPNTINCSTFLKVFYKISYNEKQKLFHENISRVNRINRNKLQTSKNIEKKFEKLTELQLKPIKQKTKENVMKKLETISHKYNQKNITKEFNSVLKVFQSTRITLKHFNEIMKHYFMIIFDGSELSVLYEMFGDFHTSSSSASSSSRYNNRKNSNNNNLSSTSRFNSKFDNGPGLSYESSQFISPSHHNNSSIDLTPSDLLFYNQHNFHEEQFNENEGNNNELGIGEEFERLGLGENGFDNISTNERNNNHNSHYHNNENEEKYINCNLFLKYFYQVTKNDKDNMIQKKNYISNRIQRIKNEYESELEKKFIERKNTKVTYPDIPDVNLSADVNLPVQSKSNIESPSQLNSQNNNNNHYNNNGKLIDNDVSFLEDGPENSFNNNFNTNMKRKKTRKLSVLDTISPNRHVLKLFKNEKSLVNLYPSASEDTKNFIRDIEKQEQEVSQMFRPSSRSTRQSIRDSGIKSSRPESAPSHLGGGNGGINGRESFHHHSNQLNGRKVIPRNASAKSRT